MRAYRWSLSATLAAVCLASPGAAQDSIAVVDRGVPPARVWTVIEFPFKLLEAPLRLVGGVAGWVANRAERGGWVPTARRVHGGLQERGVHPSMSGQGANSGFGPSLRLGSGRDSGQSPRVYVQGGITTRRYWVTEAGLGVRRFAIYVRSEDRPKDAFFGIGNDAREGDWSDYRLRRTSWGGRLTGRAAPRLNLSVGVDWARVVTARGSADDRPNIDSTFGSSERPGFGAVHRSVAWTAGLEWSAGPRHSAARRGTFASTEYRWTNSRTAGVPDAGLVRLSGAVELPFDHRRRSIVAALYFESLRPASPGTIPFYALPTLGGAQSLPSFRSDRFRERDVLLGQLAYRYRVWSDPGDALWADAELFTDGGIVAHRLVDEIAEARLHQSTGFALALMSRAALLARLSVSNGADGVGVTISMGGGF